MLFNGKIKFGTFAGACINECAAARRNKHPQTDRTQRKNRSSNRLKSKAAAKIRRHAQAFRVRRIFLRRRAFCFLYGVLFLSDGVIRTIFFCAVYVP